YQGSRADLASHLGLSQRRRRRHQDMCFRIDATPIPQDAAADARPDGTWPAVEYTLSSPGPTGGWPGRILMHLTFGWRGGFIQEAWTAPSGKHLVTRYDPSAKTGGLYVDSFATQHWELPTGDTALVVRVATPSIGSVGVETQN